MDLDLISPAETSPLPPVGEREREILLLIAEQVKIERRRGIDFTLSVLKQIEKKVNDGLLTPRDLQFTLKTSLRDLIASLEVQKFDVQ